MDDGDTAQAARSVACHTLDLVQRWLASAWLDDSRLVIVTRRGVAVGDDLPDLTLAPVWGWCDAPSRSTRKVCPRRPRRDRGRDRMGLSPRCIRAGVGRTRRSNTRAASGTYPADRGDPDGAWRLSIEREGSLDGLEIVRSGADRPLAVNEVRVGVRAAGLNFRDVLIALGTYPGEAPLGSEAAGVVLEVGSEVTDLVPGARVMGLVPDGFGPVAIADRRMVVPMPVGWSFTEAASVPLVFLTAYYGLVDLAGLRRASGCWCTRPPVEWARPQCSWPATSARKSWRRPARASRTRYVPPVSLVN
ncbi:alcohol dehydrogenase catalytic domain-containing protein [Streptomyces sp. M10(2022)]